MQPPGEAHDMALHPRIISVTVEFDDGAGIEQLGDDADDTRRREAPRPPTRSDLLA